MTARDLTPKDSWFEFLLVASSKVEPRWFFRGQADTIWDLHPGAGRKDRLGDRGYSAEHEKRVFRQFRNEVLAFNSGIETDLELMALGQHHGLPTRLLDWSQNPLVAAWFACREYDDGLRGRIHMIRLNAQDIHASDEFEKFEQVEKTGAEIAFVQVPPRVARITAQQGVFSLHKKPERPWKMPALKNGETHLFTEGDSQYSLGVEQYQVVDIPAEDKYYFCRMLHVMGVNHTRMMGDLDGVCRTLALDYKDI